MAAELSHTFGYCYRIYQMRYFWWSLVTTDLKNRYRHSFLGTAWSLARPLGMTVVLSVVFSTAFNIEIREYAPFLFLSIALWQFLTESMLAGCNSFRLATAYIRQQPVPLAIFPLRTVLGTSIHAALALVVALLLTGYFVGLPSPLVVLTAIPGVILLFFVGLALATLLGIVHTHFTDTQHLMEILLQALFYLTPVMYRPDAFAGRGRLSWLIQWNPFTALLELVRRPILNGQYPEPMHFVQGGVFLLIVGTMAWVCLHKLEKNLVYWI